MQANLLAAVLSLFVVSLPLQAADPAKIDLNQADALSLSHSVKGIGVKRAEAIVKHREEHGNFKSIEDLAQVKGLGERFVQSHRSELEESFVTK